MSEIDFGSSYEELSNIERQFIDYVDAHIPTAFDEGNAEANPREAFYELSISDHPAAINYVKVGSLIDISDALPTEHRYVEFCVSGQQELVPVLTIYYTSDERLHVTNGEGISQPFDMEVWVAEQLDKLRQLEASGRMTRQENES